MADIPEKLQKLQDWLREPDFAEHFSTDDLVDWLNRRPTGVIPSILATRAAPPAMDREAVEANWLRGDWYERWQDATENADDELMATLESLRGRVERTILAALSTLSADAIRQGEGMEERPFAHCCAEAGGRIETCDCANKNHGTAWFSTPASHASDGGKA